MLLFTVVEPFIGYFETYTFSLFALGFCLFLHQTQEIVRGF